MEKEERRRRERRGKIRPRFVFDRGGGGDGVRDTFPLFTSVVSNVGLWAGRCGLLYDAAVVTTNRCQTVVEGNGRPEEPSTSVYADAR